MEMQEVVENMFLPLPSVPPILISRAEGVYLHTSSGHRIIDASGGPMAVSIGYGRPEIADAAAAALREVSYVLPVFATEARIELVKRNLLLRIAAAWVITVPLAAMLAAMFFFMIRGMLLP